MGGSVKNDKDVFKKCVVTFFFDVSTTETYLKYKMFVGGSGALFACPMKIHCQHFKTNNNSLDI
jgi:hypothetical protein